MNRDQHVGNFGAKLVVGEAQMYEQWHGALVLTLALTAAPVWASTTSDHERLAYHHVRPGTVDCCMDAVIDLYTDTKSPIRWMPFLGTSGWATYDCNTGSWTVDETILRQKLANVRDDVATAGYLMLDWEAYADYPNPGNCVGCPCDPDTLPAQDVQDRIARMEQAADIVASWLDEEFEPGHGIRFGFYRIPDHKHPEQQTGNAYVDVLDHTNTIFITLHSYCPAEQCFNDACTSCGNDDCQWRRYQCRVECHAPGHTLVTYFFGAGSSGGCQCVEPTCIPDCDGCAACTGCPDECCYSITETQDRLARIDEFFPGSQLVVRGRTPDSAPAALDTARNWLFDLPNTCPWDCEPVSDRDVGTDDSLELLAQWFMVDTSCDFDGGGVGINDYLILLANWGPCP